MDSGLSNDLYLRIAIDAWPGKTMKQKREYQCPACGVKLEYSYKKALTIKPEVEPKDDVELTKSDAPSEPETVPRDLTKGKPRLKKGSHREQAKVIREMLYNAEPHGLFIKDLRTFAMEKGIYGDDLEYVLTHLHEQGEIWRNDDGHWKVRRV
jgi:hypothetical protein